MSLANVHDRIVTQVLNQLPTGVEILKASSKSETQSVFDITYKGKERQIAMDKTNVSKLFSGRKAVIEIPNETPLNDVYKQLAKDFDLPLIEGVDFSKNNSPVSFSGAGSVELSLSILEGSVSLFGSVQFTVINKDRRKLPTCPLTPKLGLQKSQLALLSSVLKPESKVFTGDHLTNEFSKLVCDHLNSLSIDNTLNIQDIQSSTVLEDLGDDVSRIVFVKTPDNLILPIRYVSGEKDKPTFKKTQEKQKKQLESENQ